MYDDLYVINGKAAILSSLINGNIPTAEECNLTSEDFEKICEEMYEEGLIQRTNLGNVVNAEVSNKGIHFFDNIANSLE
ncbi:MULTISPECIES: hypothetical protein [Bacillaceae]|uniref:hypothetical protein n=1 Tax=Bacillaceae TaxID=186817 RepID=UPI000BFD14AE|nr:MULTISPECIES: hypothetical protein [Bacillaceae]PGT82128.1 hypothetical protein COD11_15745 [Bacillus sp. AFS040349]UGB30296.1 hypothetical protein LPC09_21755 [Metabacillus sp. B2-18]